MSKITLYHNPRCSKSRQALKLLEEKGAELEVVRYLDTPLSAAQLTQLIEQLGLDNYHDLLRTQESAYKEGNIDENSPKAAILNALVQCPKLMKRPIAVKDGKAIIGRPPEQVLDLV